MVIRATSIFVCMIVIIIIDRCFVHRIRRGHQLYHMLYVPIQYRSDAQIVEGTGNGRDGIQEELGTEIGEIIG